MVDACSIVAGIMADALIIVADARGDVVSLQVIVADARVSFSVVALL